LIICLLFSLGCGDSSTNPEDNPPEIPPIETMTMDVSFFAGANLQSSTPTTKQNFLTAALVVTGFNVAVIAGLFVPTVATAAALSEDPVLGEDDRFHWTFFFEQVSPVISVDLSAQVNQAIVDWQMVVDRQVPPILIDFLWYDGESRIDGTSGHWQFYSVENRVQPNPAVRIDWEFQSEDDRTLTFANNDQASAGLGDWLRYEVLADDFAVTFFNASDTTTTEIVWNQGNGAGSILAPNYNNGERACWDENHDDVGCQ
jgi:hypothetical protein